MSEPSGMRPARSSAESGSADAKRSASTMRRAWRRSSGAWLSATASLSIAITTALLELAMSGLRVHARDRRTVADIKGCKGSGLAKVDLAFANQFQARPERARFDGRTSLLGDQIGREEDVERRPIGHSAD